VGKLESKRPLPSSRCGWKDNTNTDLKYIGWEDVHWIGLVQIRNKSCSYKESNEIFGSIKRGGIRDYLMTYRPLKKNSAP